jgi:hypothetical protein
MALGLVSAGAAAATTAPAPPGAPASPAQLTSLPKISTLPNGDRVLVTGPGPAATIAVLAPDGSSVPAVRFAPDPQHAYVIPDSVLATPNQFVASQYQVPALTVAGPPTTPEHFPLHILQINGVGLDGAAADGFTFLTNVDDVRRWGTPIPLAGGVARVAVPAGHYSATTMFTTYDPATHIGTVHAVTQPDITVADTGVTTVTTDERTATAQVTAATPKPSVNDSGVLLYGRTDLNGLTSTLMAGTDGPTYVTPTAKPQLGGFSYQLFGWGGASPAGTTAPYRYDLMFPASDHIDANQTYQVDASKLETSHNTVDTDAANAGQQGLYMTGPESPEVGGFFLGHFITVPGSVTDYYGAPAGDGNYGRSVMPEVPVSATSIPYSIMLQGDDPVYTGPTETWRTWGHGPLTPQVGQFAGSTWCRACADGGTVDLALNMVQDSSPDTEGMPFGPANVHLTVYRDGNQVFSQDNFYGAELTNQAQQPGTYRLVYDQDLTPMGLSQSTMTHTDITVPYSPTPDPKWTLPSDDVCYAAQAAGATPCSILPVLNLNYHLATDSTNTGHGRVQALDLRVDHQSYEGAGSHAPATGATVSVSFDKGATWTAAKVIPAGFDHFVALWQNSGAKGSAPWLKVTATDALGGSITQTVANAYTIG